MKEVIVKLILDLLAKLVTPDVVEQAKKQLVAYLREQAKKTETEIDDKIVDIVEKALS